MTLGVKLRHLILKLNILIYNSLKTWLTEMRTTPPRVRTTLELHEKKLRQTMVADGGKVLEQK